MKLAAVDIVVFGLYILVVLAVGFYASYFVKSTKREYFLAGDKLPWIMIGGSIMAANISSHHFVGVMGVAYTRGFVAMVGEWNAILIGYNVLLWVFLPFYVRNGFFTMSEFLERRFGGAARALYAALILLTYTFVEISGVLFLGAVAVQALFGTPLHISIITLAVTTGLYTILGGLRAVVWTEMLQLCVLLTGGLVLSFATLQKVGFGTFIGMSDQWHLLLPANDPDFPWTMYLGGSLCISIFYNATNQFIVQRALAAKDEWHARMGVVFAEYLKFLTPLIIIVPGLVAPVLFPHLQRGDMAFPMLVKTLLPHGLVGLVMAGLVAAIMSHISGAINSCTTIATMDIYLPYIRKDASERQAVMVGRSVGVALVVAGIIIASTLVTHSKKPVFLYLLNAYGYFTPGIATMFLLGILWRRTTHAGAMAAGLLTIPLSLLLDELPKVWSAFPHMPFQNRTGIVFWLCMVVCALVSLATKAKPADELQGLIWNKESLKLPVSEREKMRGIRSPFIWWAVVNAVVLAMFVIYH